MEKESIDLRNLILMIKEQKQINSNLINYAINYINQLTDQPLHISLNTTTREITISFMAFTVLLDFPAISPKVNEALVPYNAVLEQKGEPGKYAQLLISFRK
jgi:hypothetical protein